MQSLLCLQVITYQGGISCSTGQNHLTGTLLLSCDTFYLSPPDRAESRPVGKRDNTQEQLILCCSDEESEELKSLSRNALTQMSCIGTAGGPWASVGNICSPLLCQPDIFLSSNYKVNNVVIWGQRKQEQELKVVPAHTCAHLFLSGNAASLSCRRSNRQPLFWICRCIHLYSISSSLWGPLKYSGLGHCTHAVTGATSHIPKYHKYSYQNYSIGLTQCTLCWYTCPVHNRVESVSPQCPPMTSRS